MFLHFYQKNIIEKPKIIFAILLLFLVSFGFFSKDFRLDASSETLLIEGDPDLKYLNEINDRYGAKEFLVLTYTPKNRMIDESSIKNLLKLKNQIQQLETQHALTTELLLPLDSTQHHQLISTHHWSGVLWANLLSLAPTLWRNLVGSTPHLWWKLPLAWMKKRTTDPYVLAGAFNKKGKGVVIHPSAIVEGCWLQDGVTIGPGAVVRGCVLGPESKVEAQALLTFSVLGRGAVIQRRGWAQFSVVHAGAAVGGAMQLGVLGPRVSFKHGSYLMDQNTTQFTVLDKGVA